MRTKRDSSYGTGKALLILGRVSNLPTVWSNCLAAWLLSGGAFASDDRLRLMCVLTGATLLYLAGMFLNDAFDQKFDRKHRNTRPIPCGVIDVSTVWFLGVLQLTLGLACIIWISFPVAVCVISLAGSILWYNWVHKRITWSPVIMALCRLFLYLLAGLSASESFKPTVGLAAIMLFGYVVGLSNIARKEATGGKVLSWPCWLLVLPLVFPFISITVNSDLTHSKSGAQEVLELLPLLFTYALWIGRSLLFTFKAVIPQYGRTVSGLLAGIVLFDAMMLSALNSIFGLVFTLLFLLALILQRFIPAT